MSGGTLLVWASEGEPTAGEADLVCRWSGYAESDGQRSLLRHLERHGERLRAAFAAWVQDVGDCRVDGVRVVEHLALPDGLSYWWMTLLVEQSPWKSPRILDALRLLALSEIAAALRPAAVRLVGADPRIDEALRPWCARLGIAYRWEPTTTPRRRGLREAYRALPHPVQAAAALARYLRERWPLRAASRDQWSTDPRAVFFCSYFIHLDKESCERGRFHSRHWESLPEALHGGGIPTNWLQYYLPSSAVPSTRVALDWIRRFGERPRDEGFQTFLDAYLSPSVVWRVLRGLRWLSRRARRIGDLGVHLPVNDAPSLWPVMRGDWESSMRGSAATINLLWIALYDEALRSLPRQETGLYLLENQGWERAFIHAWRRHGHGRLIAVAHSTVRFWDLRYAADRRMFAAGAHAAPQPDLVAVNGAAAMKVLRGMGYPGAILTESEALRYGNLRPGAPSMRARAERGGPLEVLVVTDYLESATRTMLRMLTGAAERLGERVRFTVKPHPNFAVCPEDYPTLAFEVVTDPLAVLLPRVDVAFASNNTSAAVDAYVTGCPVVVALDEEELNFSPLRGELGVTFVSDAAELAMAIDAAGASTGAAEARTAYFFLDGGLPRWRRLLRLDASHGTPS